MEAYQRLEKEFGEWAGVENVVACSSGTAALHLALEAFRLPLGSEVIVPDFTMVACPRAVALAGLKPRFVDCDERLVIERQATFAATESKWVKAVVLVHTYGRRCDATDDWEVDFTFQDPTVLHIVEDLSEAHGLQPREGTDAACWSFYKNKIIAGEEGGAVAFKNPDHAAYARKLRSLGFTDSHDFNHVPRGHNYRMSNAHASLILESLRHVDENRKRRRQIEEWYDGLVPPEWRMPPRDEVWVYDLRIPGMDSVMQDRIIKGLNAHGVAARHAFKPMTLQTEWAGIQQVGPNALKASQEVIYLPVDPTYPLSRIQHHVNILLKAVGPR